MNKITNDFFEIIKSKNRTNMIQAKSATMQMFTGRTMLSYYLKNK